MTLKLKEWIAHVTKALAPPSRITSASEITVNISGDANSAIAYKEQNGTVRVDFYLRSSSNLTAGATMFTMPAGWRPSASYGGVAIITTSSGVSVVGSVSINTSGQILVPSLSSTTRGVMGHIEYLV